MMSVSTRPALCATLLLLLPFAVAAEEKILDQEKLYSQHKEELVIRDFFQDRRDGFFVDVGCAFAVKYSTTFYLEKHLGWKGIGIDALALYAEGWRAARPNSKFFTFYVDDHSDDLRKFYRAGIPALSSGIKDREFKGRKLNQTELEVPTITLNKLLELEGIEKVDFLSMDIEEAEPAALRGFDIDRYAPELVCVEATPTIREAIQTYFEAHGYARIDKYLEYDRVNWYYAPKAKLEAESAKAN